MDMKWLAKAIETIKSGICDKLSKDGKYYKLFAINVNGVKYYCVGTKYEPDVIYGFKKYADAAEAFNRTENASKGTESW